MTKAGAPSRIVAISYWAGTGRSLGSLPGCRGAQVFGERLALLLRSQGVCLGSWTHLDIQAAEGDDPSGPIVLIDGLQWWSRTARLIVPRGFGEWDEAARESLLIASTPRILSTIRPELQKQFIDACDEVVRKGDELRFLLKSKTVRGQKVDVSVNVPSWRAASFLYVTVTDLAANRMREAPPLRLRHHHDGWPLAGCISCSDGNIVVAPKDSFDARVRVRSYQTPIVIGASDLRLIQEPPCLTGPV